MDSADVQGKRAAALNWVNHGSEAHCVSDLRTRVRDGHLADNTPVKHLSHDPFAYAVRVDNAGPVREITLRVFLVPTQWTERRRMWLELDKFVYSAPSGSLSHTAEIPTCQ